MLPKLIELIAKRAINCQRGPFAASLSDQGRPSFLLKIALALVQGVGFRVWGLGFRVQGLGFRVQGLEFRVWDSWFKVYR